MVFPILRYILPFACGILASLVLTPFARQLAFRLGAIDHPGERRVHKAPVPRFGGIVIYLAMGLSLALVAVVDAFVGHMFLHSAESIVIVLAATMVLAVGILDDCGSLTPWTKLPIEILAAGMVVWTGFRI